MTFEFDRFTALLFFLPYLALFLIALGGMSAPQEWPVDEDGNPIRGARPSKKCDLHPGVSECVHRKRKGD